MNSYLNSKYNYEREYNSTFPSESTLNNYMSSDKINFNKYSYSLDKCRQNNN